MTPETPNPARKRVLSGMRPTGKLHLGNYMGALKNWVALQHQYECYFFIADWHALTTDYADPSRIPENVLEVALDFLSAGLDPEKCTIFVQSHVPQHAELHLLLSMITPLSWLERVPSYKDQQEQLREKDLATYGFLGYPLLQSADILLYKPDFVPVGQDQAAHVEITREVARRFNFFYGPKPSSIARTVEKAVSDREKITVLENTQRTGAVILREPEVLLTPSPKLPGIDGRKMSKSYGNTILLTDLRPTVLSKLEAMSNGDQRIRQSDPGDPELCPVGEMHRLFSPPDVIAYTHEGCRSASIGCFECKHLAAKHISLELDPIQSRRFAFEENVEQVHEILLQGASRAGKQAEATMSDVRFRIGVSRQLATPESSIASMFKSVGAHMVYNLEAHEDWWNLPKEERARNLRTYWLTKGLPREIVLKRDSDRVFVTASGKRLLVTTSRESDSGARWQFQAKPKTYEFLGLLCWAKSLKLYDFVVPQKVYIAEWSRIKKAAKDDVIEFEVRSEGRDFLFQIGDAVPVNINEFQSNYQALK